MVDDNEMLFDAVAVLADRVRSKYRDICQCRDDLYDFMDANEWFGLDVSGYGRNIRVKKLDTCRNRISFWLKAYQRTDAERLELLLSEYGEQFPVLCREYRRFVSGRKGENEKKTWQVLDYLLSSADGDMCFWGDEQRLRLVREASSFCTATAVRLMTDFFGWSAVSHNEEKWTYKLAKRKKSEERNDAYETEAFCRMAYQVFNENAWNENTMIEKACGNRKYAELWLFVSLHFICGLRSTDMKLLPAPDLQLPGEMVREMILSGSFTEKDAMRIASDWQYKISAFSRTPNKTRRYEGIPDITVFIPATLLVPMGVILAIADSFHEEGSAFVRNSFDYLSEKRFFGEEYAEAAGYRRFATRRANKSYLQGISFAADQDGVSGKTRGYMVAALARSHKGSYGGLARTTDIYLRDAAFSGYRPEFIIREMFERGVFGFIPAILLERYCGEEYSRLDVHSQTRLIGEIGLEPVQLEGITGTAGRALIKAESCVRECLLAVGADRQEIGRILQSIAGGEPDAKQTGYLCLRNAAGLMCSFPDRSGCLGCGYEIYTKAALHLLMNEYVRISRIRSRQGSGADRLGKILEDAVLPAVWSIVESIQKLYPDEDMTDSLDIIERGVRDAGSTGV